MAISPIKIDKGIHLTHAFYRVNRGRWAELRPSGSAAVRERLEALCQQYNQPCQPRLRTYATLGGKADLGFLVYASDLVQLGQIHREIELAFPPDSLVPVFSYLSVTELSEYTTSDEENQQMLIHQEKLEPESDAFKKRMAEIRNRMAQYEHYRLYPEIQDWEIMGFYPMSKRRNGADNWYMLDFATRKKLMGGHARVGRKYAGRVSQLISGSTGLDNWEWGVTLVAHQVDAIKEIVYEMRFDEVTARFGEFGPFFINLRLPPTELWPYLALS